MAREARHLVCGKWEIVVKVGDAMKAEVFDLSRSDLEFLIDEWIFSERDRKIFKRRLLDGITYECLAEEFDLSVRQIKNIVSSGEKRIYAKLL